MTKPWHWPMIVAGFLFLSIGFNVALLVSAKRDLHFFVEPDYYQRAARWDEEMARAAKSAALGWEIDLAISDRLTVDITDPLGHPVSGARVRVEAIHNTRGTGPLLIECTERRAGSYVADRTLDRSGLWELRISAERGAERFFTSVRREVEIRR
jgi:nitrogen fixation protein FixH